MKEHIILCHDLTTGETTTFKSMNEAVSKTGVARETIVSYIESGKSYKGKYCFDYPIENEEK